MDVAPTRDTMPTHDVEGGGAVTKPSPWGAVGVGGICGMTWGAAFRAYMAEIAGNTSVVDWYGTFVAIVGAGVLTGALLGYAHHARRTGGRRHSRWLVLAPLPFAVLPVIPPGSLAALLTTGLGGGAVGVAIFAILGGYALAGRGRTWVRVLCGVLTLVFIAGITAAVPLVGGTRLALDQPRGLWVATLAVGCMAVLCLAASIPFRRPAGGAGGGSSR